MAEAAEGRAEVTKSGLKDRLLRSFPVRIVRRYDQADGGTWATVIAWNALFAFFPIMLVVVTVVGIVLNSPTARTSIEQQVLTAFPGATAGEVLKALNTFHEHTGILGVVGVLGLLWSGSGLFGAIDKGLAALYRCKSRSFLRQKLMSFAMILVFTLLAVPIVFSSSLLPLLHSLPYLPRVFTSTTASLLIQFGAGTIFATVLFAAIFYVVPNRRQRLRSVLPGAVTAGLLFELFTLVFPLYFEFQSRAPAYGQTFALVFLVLFFFYVLGQIVMIGGSVNAELDPDVTVCRERPGFVTAGLEAVTVTRPLARRRQSP